MALFAELRRRNVLKVALLYVVASWLILWLFEHAREPLGLPLWTEMFVLLLLAIGFPVALIFAWTYEVTPAGLKKAVDVDQTQSIVYKTGQKLNAAVAVLLVLGLIALLGEGFMPKFEFLVPGVPAGDAPVSPRVPGDIRSLTLANGLKVIVWPDHDIPNVAMYNFVRAGGRNLLANKTGIAHFFEHMMFNGTENLAPGEFGRIMEAAGGNNNAYTSKDLTVYQNWFPRTALETVIGLEAERLANLAFDSGAIESERGVIRSEREVMENDSHNQRLFEQMYATAFLAHPYQHPIIGWPSDIEAWSQADLEHFYRDFYSPDNCTLVFVGDVTPPEVFELVERHLASLEPGGAPGAVGPVEPEQTGERRLRISLPAQTPIVHVAFHAVPAPDASALPLKLLLRILVDGEASRLWRSLVERQRVAISVGGWQDAGFDPGLVYIYATLAAGDDPSLFESSLLAELERLVESSVTEEELQRARSLVLADYWRQLSTIAGKASLLGDFDVVHGSYEKLFELPERIDDITADDLAAVAGQVFTRQRMTLGVVEPTQASDTAP